VFQYSPNLKRLIAPNDPYLDLKELIVMGDSGDGIPNILSDGDSFVTPGKRQKPMRRIMLEKFMAIEPQRYLKEHRENFNRNAKLISFDHIPTDIEKSILSIYKERSNKPNRQTFRDYLNENELHSLLERESEF
jgi:hypothetical protein